MFTCHSKSVHISCSIWLISHKVNIPWPTIHHNLDLEECLADVGVLEVDSGVR